MNRIGNGLNRERHRVGRRGRGGGWVMRMVWVGVGLMIWFWTQSLIQSRPYDGRIGDRLQDWLGGVNAYLNGHAGAANALLILSSMVIDAVGVFILLRAIFGPSIRPFVGLVVLLGLRQICQGLTALPAPEGMIWRYPGFPSLLVTYGVSHDLFFSGHTAVAVYGGIELGKLRGWGFKVLGVGIAVFEMVTVLALRAHWTMDVFAGAVTAMLVAVVMQGMERGMGRRRRRL